jgi:VWFA-related protein
MARKTFSVCYHDLMLRVTAALCLLATSLVTQAPTYQIEFDPSRDVELRDQDEKGNAGLFVKVRFGVSVEGSAVVDLNRETKVVIEENDHRVFEADVPRPRPIEDLDIVLALDVSGSMITGDRMRQAREASLSFVRRLPEKAKCGLILFDHRILDPVLDPMLARQPLEARLQQAKPGGGTAYLDAAQRGIALLAKSPPQRKRHLVLMTDGNDLNSTATIDEVIRDAKANKVQIVTVGIGEPGKQAPVSTVIALDRSGSMNVPADDQEQTPKIEALHRAAARFIKIMPPQAFASIVPFSTLVSDPTPFLGDHDWLTRYVKSLKADGETAFLDATYTGVALLDAYRRPGKKAVVVMTDGIDNTSRRRVPEILERAREAKVPLYLLGFGRKGEIDTATMRQLAEQTGGKFYHATNEASLIEIFENLSMDLHDDGVDEASLRRLSGETGGQYYPVADAGKLKFALDKIGEAIQHKSYEVVFPSLIQKRDGTSRMIGIKLVSRTGETAATKGLFRIGDEQVLTAKRTDYQTRGLVLAEMHPLVYLFLLGGLGFLMILPTMTGIFSAARRD